MKTNKNTALQTLKVEESNGLLDFLIIKQVRKSRNAIKSLLAHKQIKVNNKLNVQFDHVLQKGDIVTIHSKDVTRDIKKLKGLTIVYEDEYFIVIDKESGLLSVATEKEKMETAYRRVNDYVKRKKPDNRIFVLHRLDREVSGLMLFAKSEEIRLMMKKNWNRLLKHRLYTAVVEGRILPENGKITSWITEDKNLVMHSSSIDNGGQKSVTNYKTLYTNERFTMVTAKLETATKNQLRVHMKHIGHPIAGDKKYGSKTNPIKRIALHSTELGMIHPVTNEEILFKSPVPKKMTMLIKAQVNKDNITIISNRPYNNYS